jgi:SpoVK/Ycf46/Vps4 family AAA+-type ATPase
VRALAGECARRAPRPVALFARKGADCLGKYAGDAERALRLLFQQVGRGAAGRGGWVGWLAALQPPSLYMSALTHNPSLPPLNETPPQAAALAPSIVFLDELDALAPARSVRSGGGDQIYASVVSTLLALMDGLEDRGQVVVIGVTNRWGRFVLVEGGGRRRLVQSGRAVCGVKL